MNFRLIGALILCIGSSYLGFSAAGTVRRRGRLLQNLKLSLEMMRCEVSYTLTPIGKICDILAKSAEGEVRTLYIRLAKVFSAPYPEQDNWAEELVHSTLRGIPEEPANAMIELLTSFGRFGVKEQLRLIDLTAEKVTAALEQTESEKKQRCKCYQTLGICTGLAIAILVL